MPLTLAASPRRDVAKRFYLSEKDRRLVQETIRRSRAGGKSTRPVPLRRRPMGGGSSTDGGVFKLTSECSVCSGTTTLTPGTCTAQRYEPNGDDETWTLDTENEYTLYSTVLETIASGEIVQTHPIDGKQFIDVVRCPPP